jgi:hypothetical protein
MQQPPASGSVHRSATSSYTTTTIHQKQLARLGSHIPMGISPFSTWVKTKPRLDLLVEEASLLAPIASVRQTHRRGGGEKPERRWELSRRRGKEKGKGERLV